MSSHTNNFNNIIFAIPAAEAKILFYAAKVNIEKNKTIGYTALDLISVEFSRNYKRSTV